MIKKQDIIKMAKHIAKRSGGIPDNKITHQRRDWLIGLSVVSILFLTGGAYTGYVFFTAQNIDANIHNVNVETTSYDNETVNRALEIYRNKQKQFNVLREDRPVEIIEIEEDAENTSQDDTETGEEQEEKKVEFDNPDVQVE